MKKLLYGLAPVVLIVLTILFVRACFDSLDNAVVIEAPPTPEVFTPLYVQHDLRVPDVIRLGERVPIENGVCNSSSENRKVNYWFRLSIEPPSLTAPSIGLFSGELVLAPGQCEGTVLHTPGDLPSGIVIPSGTYRLSVEVETIGAQAGLRQTFVLLSNVFTVALP